jgi:hypothetical protein
MHFGIQSIFLSQLPCGGACSGVKCNQCIARHDGNHRRHNRTVKNGHVSDHQKPPNLSGDRAHLAF